MIVEYIRYAVPPELAEEVEDAYRRGGLVLDADPHCLSWEIARGVEEPENFVVRIEWDSMEGHLQGFRRSPGFREFFAAVKPLFDHIQEMKHYRGVSRPSAVTEAADRARSET